MTVVSCAMTSDKRTSTHAYGPVHDDVHDNVHVS